MILFVIAVYAGALLIDFRSVWLSKQPWVKWPCLFLFGIGFVLQAMYVLKINVPSPAPPISEFIYSVFNLK
jgi:hypothetical protein